MSKRTIAKDNLLNTSKRTEYIDKLAEQLKKWDLELAKFEKKSSKRISELKANITKKITTLRAKQHDLKEKLNRAGGVGKDAFADIKKDTERLWKDINKSFSILRKELKK